MDIVEKLTAFQDALGRPPEFTDTTTLPQEAAKEIEQLRAKVAELEKDKVIFNLYYCEEFVGTFYQGSFSTEQKAIEARDHLLEKMKDMDWKTSDFIINEEAIDQAMKDGD